MTAVVGRTRAALAEAAGEAGAGWRRIHTVLLCLFVLGCAVPWIAPGCVHVDELAAWLYLALSATGLVAAVGLAGLPSLAQGAFMTIGALTTGLLAARAGWPVEATVPVAVLASLIGGLVAGLVVVRLDSLFLAVGTWILAWLVFLGALAFPGISGGSQGYVVDSGLSTTGHYELGLALTAIAVVAVATLRRSAAGIRLRAVRDGPAAAASLGVRAERLLLGAFVAAAGVGGLAGSLSVQLAGVTDPGAFGPVVSFKLLAAVLLGGASYAVSGIVGVAVLGAIALLARLWAHLQAGSAAEVEPMFAAILLLVVLALRPEGAPLLERLRTRIGPAVRREPARPSHPSPVTAAPVVLSARSLAKHFGGVRALDGFDLEVGHDETVALVGANGSGKTTALRALAGAVPLDGGEIELDGRSVVGCGPVELASAGVVRTLQRTATFGTLTALESAVVGASLHARHGGVFRAVASTPKSRAEARELNAAALEALRTVRLERFAGVAAAQLDVFQQRRLMLAAALAARPRLLLLDEPSAGAARTEADGLLEILASIRKSGVSLVVVEHDQRLVRAIADRVVVMADGKAVPG
jgi:branched-chain amino acid transport system ATP-binding protein/branched-chain amino acid transport system permease protein